MFFQFQGHLHPTTVIWGLRILMTLISMPALLEKFRLGTCNGHWLIKSEIVLQNKMVQALGQSSTTTSKVTRRGNKKSAFFSAAIMYASFFFLILRHSAGHFLRARVPAAELAHAQAH